MANGDTKRGNARTPGFDLGKFTAGLDQQREKIAERQAAEAAHAARTTQINEEAASLRSKHRQSLEPFRQRIQESGVKREHGEALKSSNNIVDLLRHRGLKIMDPQGYDPEERRKSLAEDMQRASAIAQVYNVSFQELESELALSQAQLNEKKVIETIGHEKLTRIQEEAALAADNLDAHITMQEVATHGMDSDQLRKSIQQAEATPNKEVELGGVPVSSQALRQRLASIEEREHEQQLESFERAQEQAEMEEADDIIAAQRLERNNERQKIIGTSRKRRAKTFDLPELEGIRENDYVDEAGDRWDSETINSEIEQRVEGRKARIDRLSAQARLSTFDDDFLVDERQRVDSLYKRVPEGTDLARSTKAYKASIGFAATLTGPENDDSVRQEGLAIIDSARKKLDKAVEDRVKKEAPKDDDMQAMLRAYYQGNPLPESSLHNATSERLRNHRSLADIFPPQIAAAVTARYKEEFSRSISASGGRVPAGTSDGEITNRQVREAISGGGGGASTSAQERKLLQEESIQKAIEWGMEQYTQQRSVELLANQVKHKDHPLRRKGWSPNRMASVLDQADEAAKTEWMQKHDLTSAQAEAVIRGDTPGDLQANPKKLRGDLKRRQDMQFAMRLESHEAGLAGKVANWWQEHGMEYTSENQRTSAGKVQSFHHAAVQEFSSNLEFNSMNNYGRRLSSAVSGVQDEHARRQSEFITFGSNPTVAQAAILNADSNLKPHEKKRVFGEVLTPLLAQAQQQGMNFSETNAFIERQLMEVEPQNKEVGRLLKMMNRERADIVEKYETWAGAAREFRIGPGPRRTDGSPPGPSQAGSIGWFQEMMNESSAPNSSTSPSASPSPHQRQGTAPWKPWLDLGPVKIGGSVEDYETYRRNK